MLWKRRETTPHDVLAGPAFGRFVRAVAQLALPADAQQDVLRALGTWPSSDELALEFDDVLFIIESFAREGWVNDEFVREVRALDALLDSMSGESNAALWDAGALDAAPEWQRVRVAARGVLFALGGPTYHF